MKIVYLTAGAGGMYCGSCMRDNTLAAALGKLGHEALLVPTYTPIRTDEEDVVFLGHRPSLEPRSEQVGEIPIERAAVVLAHVGRSGEDQRSTPPSMPQRRNRSGGGRRRAPCMLPFLGLPR